MCDERPRRCRMKSKKSLRPQRFRNVMKTSENIITKDEKERLLPTEGNGEPNGFAIKITYYHIIMLYCSN